jgi:hypothetical protein
LALMALEPGIGRLILHLCISSTGLPIIKTGYTI